MYGLGIAKGMLLTLKHIFRAPTTEQYPEEALRLFPRFRGFDFAWDIERCTGCASCAKACPHGVIVIETRPGHYGKYEVVRFDINRANCMFCALCVEACPYEALHMGSARECASYAYDGLWIDRDLLVNQWYNEQIRVKERMPSSLVRPQFDAGRRSFPHIPKVGEASG